MDNRHSPNIATFKSAGWRARARSNYRAWQAFDLTTRAVAWWHVLLCAIAVANLVLWAFSAIAVHHASPANLAQAAASRLQLLLAAGYVFGCAFRCMLPVFDIPRVVLVGSRLSSVVVGRCVATVAELCFAVQWALMLHRMAFLSHSLPGQALSLAIVPLILIAEGCSWYAVLTTAQRPHAFENSFWGVSAALLVVSLLLIDPHRVAGLYPTMIVWCVGGAAYVAYIFLFDVPAYWARWRADETSGRRYLSIAQGAKDVCRRRIVSHSWELWKSEIVWMSLYFTFGVWTSISLVYASITLGGNPH